MYKRFILAVFVLVMFCMTANAQQPVPADKPVEGGKDEGLAFNFDTDIKQVIKAIFDQLGEAYVIGADVHGIVSVRTGKKLRKDELLPFLRIILANGGFRIIEVNGVYTIERAQVQTLSMLPIYTEEQVASLPKDQRLSLLVLPLRETKADAMAKIVSSYLSGTGRLSFAPDVNALLIVDYPNNLRSMKALVDILDVNKYVLKIYSLKFADANEIVAELDKVFAVEKRTQNLSFVALARINAVMVRNTNEKMLAEVEKWINSLDKEIINPASKDRKTYYYTMSNKDAEQVAAILTALYSEIDKLKAGDEEEKSKRPMVETGDDGTKKFVGRDFVIVPDKVNNALLIHATEARYREILKTLDMLDRKSKQILVEVMIAEVRLDRSTELGVEWTIQDIVGRYTHTYGTQSGLGSNFSSGAAPFDTGLNYLIFKTNKLLGFLNALQTEQKLTVLSSPYLMATDNKEATTNVIDEVPIINRTINNDIVTESTEYRDAGIKLGITPHINDKNMVTLELSIESSEVIGSSNPPQFFRRKVKTLVSMEDNQTLFIGGLIQRNTTKYRRGIPGLVRVPIVGHLFGNSRDAVVGTELIIVLTPRIIDNDRKSDALTKLMQERIAIEEVKKFKADIEEKPKKKSWWQRRKEKK